MKNKIEFETVVDVEIWGVRYFQFLNGPVFSSSTEGGKLTRELCPKKGEHFKVTIQRVKR